MAGKVFQGLDYQGRHPQAAEAATEVGADDDRRNRIPGAGVVVVPVAFAVAAVAVWRLFSWVFA